MATSGISISVIIPAYNASESISSALDSVINQSTGSSLREIIVINDGSTDDTLAVIKSYASKDQSGIPISIINQVNAGVSTARNAGISAAKGDWVALLDADDRWEKSKIQKTVLMLERYPEIRVLGTNRDKVLRKHGRKYGLNIYKLSLIDELWKYWPSTPTLVIHKDVFAKVGVYDVSRTHAEDGDLLLRMAAVFGVFYLYEPLTFTSDKPAYGHSGLSGNNRKMHEGCILNIDSAQRRGEISKIKAHFFKGWENIKYARRVVITGLRGL